MKCVHHWVIERPKAGKLCGRYRRFPSQVQWGKGTKALKRKLDYETREMERLAQEAI